VGLGLGQQVDASTRGVMIWQEDKIWQHRDFSHIDGTPTANTET